MPQPVVSLIMLAHNKSRYTALALAGLLETAYPAAEVILVDNGSTDDTRQVYDRFAAAAERKGWTVKQLLFDENVGAVRGRNLALCEVAGEYVAFLDNDVVPGSRSWLARLQARLEADATLGVIGPKILFAAPPHDIQCAGCVVCRGGRVDFRGRGEPADAPAYNCETEVQCLISACWLMPRRAVEETGELDMLFHPVQFEDIDYCYRLRERGYRALYYPAVHVYHFENVTTGGTPSLNYTYRTVKNGVKFKEKWRRVYAKENGPDDASIVWREIPHATFDQVGRLEMTE